MESESPEDYMDVRPEGPWQDSAQGIEWALRNHPPSEDAVELLAEATDRYVALIEWVRATVPCCSERSLAMDDARASLRGVKAAICCHQDQLD
jgi:hypothetical protein